MLLFFGGFKFWMQVQARCTKSMVKIGVICSSFWWWPFHVMSPPKGSSESWFLRMQMAYFEVGEAIFLPPKYAKLNSYPDYAIVTLEGHMCCMCQRIMRYHKFWINHRPMMASVRITFMVLLLPVLPGHLLEHPMVQPFGSLFAPFALEISRLDTSWTLEWGVESNGFSFYFITHSLNWTMFNQTILFTTKSPPFLVWSRNSTCTEEW